MVYWELLKSSDPVGVREIQRRLDFSTPSLVVYHITKLEKIDLVNKTQEGSYFVIRKANIADLRDLIIFRTLNKTFALPRMIMYALIFTILYLLYLPIFFILDFGVITNSFIFANLFAIIGIIIFWFETYKTYQGLPFN